MNSRQRYYAVTHYEPADRTYQWEFGPYPETLKRWRREGMPQDRHLADMAGYDRYEVAPIHVNLLPGFEHEVLEETADYRIYRDGDGVKKRIRKDTPPPAMPQYLEYPLRTRKDWAEFKKRLDPTSPARYPRYWEQMKREYAIRDYPLGIHAGSMFGWLRYWMGVENIAVALYDDPAWIREMMDYLAEFIVQVIRPALQQVQFDFAVMWEDMAYKTASLISPSHVREFMMPGYRRITELLHKHGIEIIMLDSDGNVEELIPLWLEVGINFIYPMEVAAGMDVVRLRRRFGKDLRMGGGMDKRILASNKRAIKAMVDAKKALIREGGYVPGVDHGIPPDISWENFMYYRRLLLEIG